MKNVFNSFMFFQNELLINKNDFKLICLLVYLTRKLNEAE